MRNRSVNKLRKETCPTIASPINKPKKYCGPGRREPRIFGRHLVGQDTGFKVSIHNDGSTVRRDTHRETPSTRHDDDDEEIGYLGVSSSPRGIVYIDGDNTGQMTPARRIELDPGRHEVRLFYESEDEFSETKSVLIRAGVNTNVFFRYRREELSEDHVD